MSDLGALLGEQYPWAVDRMLSEAEGYGRQIGLQVLRGLEVEPADAPERFLGEFRAIVRGSVDGMMRYRGWPDAHIAEACDKASASFDAAIRAAIRPKLRVVN